jgi:hexosaminidase
LPIRLEDPVGANATAPPPAATGFDRILPAPALVEPAPGPGFQVTPGVRVVVRGGPAAAGEPVAAVLRAVGGGPVPVEPVPTGQDDRAGWPEVVEVDLAAGSEPGSEGYALQIAPDRVLVRAATPAGLWYAAQTLAQLLPPIPGPASVPSGRIVDRPRYAYRGFMLDVARHFFGVDPICRLVDELARLKLNHLHLHLTDDQGWRIAIAGWPELTGYGGGTDVSGGSGGYLTADEYSRIVGYAAARQVTVVPEIDLPGHTNAALACYPGLNLDGIAPQRYTGIEVGFSALTVSSALTFRFLDEVLAEVAALTPGPYLHIGGDESKTLTEEDYGRLVRHALGVVRRCGKQPVGWHEMARYAASAGAVVQYWGIDPTDLGTAAVVASGAPVILSPPRHAYLDQKYAATDRLGLSWAATVEVADAYGWDPAALLPGLPADRVLGIEAALWTETVRTEADLDVLAFPRLAALAELAWSSRPPDWDAFRRRLAAQGPRWDAAGIGYHRSVQIPWPG